MHITVCSEKKIGQEQHNCKCVIKYLCLLALSSSVLSSHCTDDVCRGSDTSAIRWRARLQQRSARMGFLLYGMALEPAERRELVTHFTMVCSVIKSQAIVVISFSIIQSYTYSPICSFSNGSSISFRLANRRISVQIYSNIKTSSAITQYVH